MRKFHSLPLDVGYFIYRWVNPILDPFKFTTSIPRYTKYILDTIHYASLQGAEPITLLNMSPQLHERTSQTGFDEHYFYQDAWACRKIFLSHTKHHYDVGSSTSLISHLTAFTKVTFIDIRPLKAKIKNLDSRKGDILHLPLPDNSVRSLSCLSVAEHIGMGRYGDRLDPYGTKKACGELARVLARGGKLYFSVPVGKPRLCFNVHRVHAPKQILDNFKNLHLAEFSCVDDRGNFKERVSVHTADNADYACGMFEFTKK